MKKFAKKLLSVGKAVFGVYSFVYFLGALLLGEPSPIAVLFLLQAVSVTVFAALVETSANIGG